MKLLVALVTYNRCEYTMRTLSHLLSTLPIRDFCYIVVVDNASTDATHDFLDEQKSMRNIDMVIKNPENYYPGKACNIAWQEGLLKFPEATHLMRLDNDMELFKLWWHRAKSYFDGIPQLGQLGLDHEAIEGDDPRIKQSEVTINRRTINQWPGNVGGPNIIKREVWERGIRYNERPWSHDGTGPAAQEDVLFSLAIKQAGYLVGHATKILGKTFANESNWHKYKDYYKKTMKERGYEQIHAWLYQD